MTGNALAIARFLEPHFALVLVAGPHQRQEAGGEWPDYGASVELVGLDLGAGDGAYVLALASTNSRVLRWRISRRGQLVKQRTQAKMQAHAVLDRNLKGRPPVGDLFGARGRKWLVDQESPADGHDTVKGCLRQVDFLNEEILHLDQPIAEEALGSPDILRLMTIPGVSVTNGGDLTAMGRRHRPLSQRRATWSATSVLI